MPMAASRSPTEPEEGVPESTFDVTVQRAEYILGLVLQIGVTLSAALILTGLTLLLLTNQTGYNTGSPNRALVFARFGYPSSPGAVLAGALAGRSLAIIELGLLVLILTPIVNVVISALAFAWEREVTFVVISILIFVLLAAGFLLGTAV